MNPLKCSGSVLYLIFAVNDMLFASYVGYVNSFGDLIWQDRYPFCHAIARHLTTLKCKRPNRLRYILMPLILGIGSASNFTSGKINSGGGEEGLMFGMNILSGAEE